MPTYRFRLIATDGVIQTAGPRDADSDDAACREASDLLLESAFPVIEVWRNDGMIFRLSKVVPDQPVSTATESAREPL